MTGEKSTVRGKQAIAVILLLAVGAVARFHQLGAKSLWLDEVWSFEMAMGRGAVHETLADNVIHTDQVDLTGLAGAGPWWSIWTHMDGWNHPPMYPLLLRWWMDGFGESESAARSLSVILSLAAGLVFYDVCRLMHGRRTGLLGLAIFMLAMAQIAYAREARNYAMIEFFSLCCCDALVRIEKKGVNRRRLAGLLIALLATGLTHYFAAGSLAMLGVYAVVRLRGRERRLAVAMFAAAAGVMLVTWGPWFYRQIHSYPPGLPGFLVESSDGHVGKTWFRLMMLPTQFVFGDDGPARLFGLVSAVPAIFAIGLFAAVTILAPLVLLYWRRDWLIWVLWAGGTIVPLAVSDLLGSSAFLHYIRYELLASPPVYAVVASFGGAFRKLGEGPPPLPSPGVPEEEKMRKEGKRSSILGYAVPAIVLVILAGLWCSWMSTDVPTNTDFRQLAGYIDGRAGSDELVAFYNDSFWLPPGAWYLGIRYYLPGFHRPWLTLRMPLDAKILGQLGRQRSMWLVGREPEMDGPTLFPGWSVVPGSFQQTEAGGVCRLVRNPAAFASR